MQRILAIDAGGTSTRAVIAGLDGRCEGFGRGAGGNPISSGVDGALRAVADATAAALRQASVGADAAAELAEFECIVVAMAGKSGGLPDARISERLAELGVRGRLELESDLLAMFCSGTASPDGYALAAGTGAVAARVRGHRLDRVAGGTGWLLGDEGSGFWIGHRVARAVIAHLDGLGPETALTALLLAELGLNPSDGEPAEGRPGVLVPLIAELYDLRPVQLSRFAPLAFRAGNDEVATRILGDAASALAAMLDAAREPGLDGPLVLGGSVLGAGLLAAGSPVAVTLLEDLRASHPVPVNDGAVGAALLALLHAGVDVDDDLFARLTTTVERHRITRVRGRKSSLRHLGKSS